MRVQSVDFSPRVTRGPTRLSTLTLEYTWYIRVNVQVINLRHNSRSVTCATAYSAVQLPEADLELKLIRHSHCSTLGQINQAPQPTGYMSQNTIRSQQPQQPQQLQSQPTGYPPMQRPMQTGFQQPSYQQPQPTGFLSAQQTGYPGGGAGGAGINMGMGMGAMPSQFLSTFMPAPNSQPSPYMDPSQMQFARAQNTGSLEQQIQQQNQAQTGQATVPIPWALTPDEKKRYDQIFRAWDQQGTGFIEGRVSKEVFGQAGLDQNDLMAIW